MNPVVIDESGKNTMQINTICKIAMAIIVSKIRLREKVITELDPLVAIIGNGCPLDCMISSSFSLQQYQKLLN